MPTDRPAHELAAPDGRFVTIDGVDVHHEVAGPPGAPAIVLSHHFYGSVGTWRSIVPALAGDHLVVAFDRPGFGLTERPPRSRWPAGRSPYTRDAGARIGWGLLDHLGVDQAVLIGSSAGGTHVLEMFERAPERVRGLVLLSPAITGDVGAPPWSRRWLRGPHLRWLGPRIVRRAAGEITRERVSRSWHDASRVTDQHVAPYRRMLRVHGWERGLWEVLTAEQPPDLRATLRRVDVPTVVIGGASDRVVPPRLNRRTADAIAGAHYVELPGCGHTPQEECPDELAAEIRRFLDELDTNR